MVAPQFSLATQRGRMLLQEIDKPISVTTDSQWTTFSSLVSQGWVQEKSGPCVRFSASEPDTSMLGLPPDDLPPHDSRVVVGSRHITWRFNIVTGYEAVAGGAYYVQHFHPSGTIYATSLRSPAHTVSLVPLKEREAMSRHSLPAVQRWSDVTFLQWAELCEDVPALKKGLKSVVHCNITNIDTLAVIFEIVGKELYAKGLPYPGKTFARVVGEEQLVAALLGTPNGIGTGYLLAQHKVALGHKTIESIQIYTDIKWFVVFKIGEK